MFIITSNFYWCYISSLWAIWYYTTRIM